MKYDLILIRYGELSLKSTYVRRQFESTLVNNIKHAFRSNNISCRIHKERGRIYLSTDNITEGISTLQKIFGITSVSPAIQTTSDIKSISKLAISISKESIGKKKSFALRVTRTGTHEYTSRDVAVQVGNDIVNAMKARVDLSNPDFELFIEIRNEKAFMFTEKMRGTGGLPLGTQGKILAIVDKPESLLAAWYLMRRGCKVQFVYTDESLENILRPFISTWYANSDVFPMFQIENLYENIDTLTSEKKCKAIVTGHTLSKNPQQTLSEISQLKQNSNFSILHPLISMKENEIKEKCKEIGVPL